MLGLLTCVIALMMFFFLHALELIKVCWTLERCIIFIVALLLNAISLMLYIKAFVSERSTVTDG
jgi:hypothetical protein